MPNYSYFAKSFKGEIKSGTLEVKNEKELARFLRQEGYILISANLETKKKKIEIFLPFFKKSVSLTDKMMFTRNLQVMVSAGISLPRAIRTLSLQTKNKNFQQILLEVAEEINKGNSLSDALIKYPNFFSELFQSMIKVGEESGTLEEVLKVLTRQMERDYELKSKIKGALIYPAVIVCAMIGIGVLMLVMVVPKLAATFEELGAELPPTTRFVIGLGTFLAQKWFIVILIIAIVVFILRLSLKTKNGKKILDGLVLKLPAISSLIKKTNSASTSRTLSSLISSGVPLLRSLEIISGTLGNFYFHQAIADSIEKVRKGQKLSEALSSYQNLYPPLVIQMLEVGEETGETAEILGKLSDFFEDEVANTTKNLSAVIEPVMMLLIGGAVGFFAISMIQPMYSMLGAIK
jgi:type IV pilus assembly protein PilC